MLSSYNEEDDRGTVFSGEHGRLKQARLLPSLHLLPLSPPLGHYGGSWVAIEWRCGEGKVLGLQGGGFIIRP